LIAEVKRREALKTRKKMLSEVSGITNDDILEQLVAHDIHPQALAAFSLVPVVEVAWADGSIQPEERKLLFDALKKANIPNDSIAFKLLEQWLEVRPKPMLMTLWTTYTRELMVTLTPEARKGIQETVLKHARMVAEAAGGFLGLGRISSQEEKVMRTLGEAFVVPGA
jgi:hypothetical protein